MKLRQIGAAFAASAALALASAPADAQKSKDTIRYVTTEAVKLLDLGLQKAFRFSNSKYQLKLMFDVFNVFNINTITDYSTDNRSSEAFSEPTQIIAPRVYRVGLRVAF